MLAGLIYKSDNMFFETIAPQQVKMGFSHMASVSFTVPTGQIHNVPLPDELDPELEV